MTAWHENNELWRDIAPVVFSSKRWADAEGDVKQLIELVSPPEGGSVLDLGCGQGRHSLALARRGFRVTGVDRSREYLDVARAKAAEAGIAAEWVHEDMRRFRREGAFDLAVNLLTSFGYFEDPADELATLQSVHAGLKPGGQLVIDVFGKEALARLFRERDWHTEEDGTLVLEERAVRDDWTWLDVRWILVRGEKRREHRLSLKVYSAAELKSLLSAAGFGVVRAFGSFAGAPYDHRAERLVVVATRD